MISHYTLTQLEEMTNVDLDAVVATDVMGWVEDHRNRFGAIWRDKNGQLHKGYPTCSWSPSTTWDAMGGGCRADGQP